MQSLMHPLHHSTNSTFYWKLLLFLNVVFRFYNSLDIRCFFLVFCTASLEMDVEASKYFWGTARASLFSCYVCHSIPLSTRLIYPSTAKQQTFDLKFLCFCIRKSFEDFLWTAGAIPYSTFACKMMLFPTIDFRFYISLDIRCFFPSFLYCFFGNECGRF